MSTTQCQHIEQELLSASTVASALAQPAVAAHLPQCPACQALAAKLQRLEQQTLTLPAVETAGPSEAFLEEIRALKLPSPRIHRVIWIRRSAAAAIIIAVGLMALSVCLMNQRSARADGVLRDLVQWNLDISAAHDPAQRQKIYAQKVAALTKELAAASLSAGEKHIADELLETAQWLQTENDRLAEAVRFESLLHDVGAQQQARGAIASQSTMESLQADLLHHGVQDNLQGVHADELTPQEREEFNELQRQITPAIPAPQSAPLTAPGAPATGAGASDGAGLMPAPSQNNPAIAPRGIAGPLEAPAPVQVMVTSGPGHAAAISGGNAGTSAGNNPAIGPAIGAGATAGIIPGRTSAAPAPPPANSGGPLAPPATTGKNGGTPPVSLTAGGNPRGFTGPMGGFVSTGSAPDANSSSASTSSSAGTTAWTGSPSNPSTLGNPPPTGAAGWVSMSGDPDRQPANRVTTTSDDDGPGWFDLPTLPLQSPAIAQGWTGDLRSPRDGGFAGGGPSSAITGSTGPASFGRDFFALPDTPDGPRQGGFNSSGNSSGPSGPATAIATGGNRSTSATTADGNQLQTVITTGPGGGLVSKLVAIPGAASPGAALSASSGATAASATGQSSRNWPHNGWHGWNGGQDSGATDGAQGGWWSAGGNGDWTGGNGAWTGGSGDWTDATDGTAGATWSAQAWQLYQAKNQSDATGQASFQAQAVASPEPGAGLIGGAGFLLLLLRRRRH